MKKIILSFIFSFICFGLFAQEEGIAFFHGSIDEAFAEAKKQNKPLFIGKYENKTPKLIIWNLIAAGYCFRIFRLRTMF